jgi:hypothetical protein
MTAKRFLASIPCALLGLAVGLSSAGIALAQVPPPPPVPQPQQPPLPPGAGQPPGQQEGMEILARGPIHEAFAEPVEGVPQAGPVIVKAPPAPVEEIPPDQAPQGNMQWIPGYWAWDDDRKDFIWISGVWRQPPPDRQWVPGQWVQVANGWQWTAGMWTPVAQQQLNYLPPPPAPLEAPASAPAPTATSVFVPGTWYYQQTRYVWRAGYWMEPQAGWVWIPAHFVWTPAGYVFLEGHWDLDLARRGMMFAPIYFTSPIYRRPSWYYRPSFVVQTDFLMGALFIRPGYSTYYFGDFFDARYRRRGFVSFVDFRFGRTGIDPLYGYYRWSNRAVPHWDADLRGVYANRFNNVAVRPPHTLVQQNTVIQNANINKNVGNFHSAQALVSLNQVKQQGNVRLQAVTGPRLEAEKMHVKGIQTTSVQRVAAEQAFVKKGNVPIRANDAPHTFKFTVPVQHPAVSAQTKIVAPPPPPGNKPKDPGRGAGPGRGNLSLGNDAVGTGTNNAGNVNFGTPLKPLTQLGGTIPTNGATSTSLKVPANTLMPGTPRGGQAIITTGQGGKPITTATPPQGGTRGGQAVITTGQGIKPITTSTPPQGGTRGGQAVITTGQGGKPITTPPPPGGKKKDDKPDRK